MQDDMDFENMMLSISVPVKSIYQVLKMNREQMFKLYIKLNEAAYKVVTEWNEGDPNPEVSLKFNGLKERYSYGDWFTLYKLLGDWIETVPFDEPGDDFMS